MKSLLVAACLAVAVSVIRADGPTDPYMLELKPMITQCAKEHGYKEVEVEKIHEEDKKMDEKTMMCMRACVMKQSGLMKDSKIDAAKMDELIDKVHAGHADMQDKLKKASAQCIKDNADETDECKLAFAYTKCFETHN